MRALTRSVETHTHTHTHTQIHTYVHLIFTRGACFFFDAPLPAHVQQWLESRRAAVEKQSTLFLVLVRLCFFFFLELTHFG